MPYFQFHGLFHGLSCFAYTFPYPLTVTGLYVRLFLVRSADGFVHVRKCNLCLPCRSGTCCPWQIKYSSSG